MAASIATFAVTTYLSTLCMIKMVECKQRVVEDFKAGNSHGLPSHAMYDTVGFGTLGHAVMGSAGRRLVDASIACSQLLFSTSYLIFVSKTLAAVAAQLGNCSDAFTLPGTWIVWCLVPLVLPLVFVRHLKRFGTIILIADGLIVLGLVSLAWRNVALLQARGVSAGVIQFDPVGWWPLLGTAIYALEGTAFIIPIEHSMRNKRHFPRIAWISSLAIGTIYMLFGALGYAAHGSGVQAMATLNFDARDPLVISVQIAYAIALLLSFPIGMFPAVQIAEAAWLPSLTLGGRESGDDHAESGVPGPFRHKLKTLDVAADSCNAPGSSSPADAAAETAAYLSPSLPSPRVDHLVDDESESSALAWRRNALRVALTIVAALVATVGASSFDNYISLVGGVMCVPLTLIYPAWFHLQLCGDRASFRQRYARLLCRVSYHFSPCWPQISLNSSLHVFCPPAAH